MRRVGGHRPAGRTGRRSQQCEERPCPSKSVGWLIRRIGRVSRGIVNLGILAHVDAGKTSLTERLLYCAGVIDEAGRVDDGTTQTERLALELQRVLTPLFINKIDRRGAGDQRVLADIAERLTPASVPMGTVRGLGARAATFLPAATADD